MTLGVRHLTVPFPRPNANTTVSVSEIAITRCLVPYGFVGDMCSPDTSPEMDAIEGKWVRVDRDLNRETGVWSLVRLSLGICVPR